MSLWDRMEEAEYRHHIGDPRDGCAAVGIIMMVLAAIFIFLIISALIIAGLKALGLT